MIGEYSGLQLADVFRFCWVGFLVILLIAEIALKCSKRHGGKK